MTMQTAQRTIVDFGLNRPKTVIIGALVITMILMSLIATTKTGTALRPGQRDVGYPPHGSWRRRVAGR